MLRTNGEGSPERGVRLSAGCGLWLLRLRGRRRCLAWALNFDLDVGVAVAVPLDLGGGHTTPPEPRVVFPVRHDLADEAGGEALDTFFVEGEAKFECGHCSLHHDRRGRLLGPPSETPGGIAIEMRAHRLLYPADGAIMRISCTSPA